MKKILYPVGILCMIMWSGCLFAGIQQIKDIVVSHPSSSQTKIEIQFDEKPEYFYHLRSSPFAVVIYVQGKLSTKKYTFPEEQALKSVETTTLSQWESQIVINLTSLAEIALEDQRTSISILVSGLSSRVPVQRPVQETTVDEEVPEIPVGSSVSYAGTKVGDYTISRIILDPGHGGWDSGAFYGGVHEKDINLQVALKIERLLKKDGHIEVDLTRRGDYYVTLRERTLVANQMGAELFISIHCNASRKSTSMGIETYCCSENASNEEAAQVARTENAVIHREEENHLTYNAVDIEEILFQFERKLYWEESQKICEKIQKSLLQTTGLENRGVQSAPFEVLKNVRVPSILLEMGFLSNRTERRLLNSDNFQWKLARGVLKGLGVE